MGLSPRRYYKDNIFSREIQIALTLEYKSEMLKCSDLQQRGSAMFYITRRAPKASIRKRVRGCAVEWRTAFFEKN